MIPRVPLREALSDPNLLGAAIAGDSWRSWRTLLIAAMGEELREDEREIFSKLTGRDREPLQRVDQFAAVIGRRGGKSCAMATLACYLAGLCEHTDALVPGERGVLLCVALDQRVAKIILDYAEASFERSPILKQLIASRTADALELTNGITLEVRPASFRKLRGPTYVAVIADELALGIHLGGAKVAYPDCTNLPCPMQHRHRFCRLLHWSFRIWPVPSLLFNWRRRMLEGGLQAVQADEDVVGLPSVIMPCADCAGRMIYKTKRLCFSELEDSVYACRICGAELIRTSVRAGCKLDPPIRGQLPRAGKSPLEREYAVGIEPVL